MAVLDASVSRASFAFGEGWASAAQFARSCLHFSKAALVSVVHWRGVLSFLMLSLIIECRIC